MKTHDKCLVCTINQVIKVADMVGKKDKDNLLKKVFKYLSEVNFKTTTTPELIGELFSLLKVEVNNEDPYKEIRTKYNTMFLERTNTYEKKISQSKDSFLTAIKYAIAGNIIDFNPIHNFQLCEIDAFFEEITTMDLAIDDSQKLMQEIQEAKNILYLGDNCGEICLDKILLKKMKEINSTCNFFFGTRGVNVVNDSIEEDAYFVGIDKYASIVNNGDKSLGTVLHQTSAEFMEIYNKADLVVAKGQANYESLSDEHKNIYFLLMTKCDVIATDIGVKLMQMICMKNRIC